MVLLSVIQVVHLMLAQKNQQHRQRE